MRRHGRRRRPVRGASDGSLRAARSILELDPGQTVIACKTDRPVLLESLRLARMLHEMPKQPGSA
jgi:hypothetical protein